MATEKAALLTPDPPDDGAPDVLTALSADHQKLLGLFETFETALEEDSEDEARDIAEEILSEIELHSRLEEEIFYPAAAEFDELVIMVDEAQREHAAIDQAIEEIRDEASDAAALANLMLRLQEEVEQHVRDEENLLFPRVEEVLEARLDELGLRLQRRREELTDEG